MNLHYLRTLQCAVDLENWVGEPELGKRWAAKAATAAAAIGKLFWNENRGLWADEEAHASFSQHAQALAILTGLRVPALPRWLDAPGNGLAAATNYFQHYMFEALGRLGRGDLVLQGFHPWRELVKLDLKNPLENPQIGRSDCHAWGAHPLFHLHATIAGVRPLASGFRSVRITPQPGKLARIETEMPHPRGRITVKAAFAGKRVMQGLNCRQARREFLSGTGRRRRCGQVNR